MQRHDFDWPSAIAGIALVSVGVGFSIGNLGWSAVRPGALWAAIVVLVGLLITASAFQRLIRSRAHFEHSEEIDTADRPYDADIPSASGD